MPNGEDVDALRPLLMSIAYRMLSSFSDAEDVVQEAFLRYQRALAEGTRVASPRAFLSAVTTRLCIDQLRSARVRRETYVGAWLPEPLPAPEPCELRVMQTVAACMVPARPAPPPAEPAIDPGRAAEVLADVLEHLGSAHHRPFSRA